MTGFGVLVGMGVGCIGLVGGRASAQMPSDNDMWKARCTALSASASAIDHASAPPELLQTTRGISGDKFSAVAHERAGAGQHYIACTLYYTAAMAYHMGNGGRIDGSKAHTNVVLGGTELKLATGQPLTFGEKMDRASSKLPSSRTAPLTPMDVQHVFGAFGEGQPGPPGQPGPGGPPQNGGFNTPPPTSPQ
jgi:hypothetical protein